MNLNNPNIDQEIINHRGDIEYMDSIIEESNKQIAELDELLELFLEKYCPGKTGIDILDLDTSNPAYRFYNYQTEKYAKYTRLIKLANAYK